MKRGILFLLLALAMFNAIFWTTEKPHPVQAEFSAPQSGADTQVTNYCIGCHTTTETLKFAEQGVLLTTWVGGIEGATIHPSPALAKVQREIYYTDRLLSIIERTQNGLPTTQASEKLASRYTAGLESYNRLLDAPITSIDAFVSEMQTFRYQMGKLYTQAEALAMRARQFRVLVGALGATSVILVALLMGLRLTSQYASTSQAGFARRSLFIAIGAVILIFILFSLPLFRVFTASVIELTEEESTRLETMDTASRTASANERALARSWALAQVAAAWQTYNQPRALENLSAALTGARDAQLNAGVLWGEQQAVQEVSAGDSAAMEQAQLIQNSLISIDRRAWGFRAIAETIENPEIAQTVYELAINSAANAHGIYRDYDLRALATSMAGIAPLRAEELARSITDPAVKAWALRELADKLGKAAILNDAIQVARTIKNPIGRALELGKLSVLLDDDVLLAEASGALLATTQSEMAFGFAELVRITGDERLLININTDFPQALALAYYNIGDYEKAWESAAEIPDSFERYHALESIAVAAGDYLVADQISHPFFHERATREVSLKTGDVALAWSLQSPYDKVVALTRLGYLTDAVTAADSLTEPYPLIELIFRLASNDAAQAETLIESLSREADKAVALRELAVQTGDQVLFERALAMAFAARVRNDPLSPVYASLALANSFPLKPVWAEAAIQKAEESAFQITVK